jgi:hypothetical protein
MDFRSYVDPILLAGLIVMLISIPLAIWQILDIALWVYRFFA